MSVLQKIGESRRFQAKTLDDELLELQRLKNTPRSPKTKLLKAEGDSFTAVAVSPNLVEMTSSVGEGEVAVGVSVTGGTGTLIRGPLGFLGAPSQFRIGGMWTLNDTMLSAAPSTILTPIPVLKFSPPLQAVLDFTIAAGATMAVFGLA
jgi:hypothetical protein